MTKKKTVTQGTSKGIGMGTPVTHRPTYIAPRDPEFVKAFSLPGLEVYAGSYLNYYPAGLPKPDLFLRLADQTFHDFPETIKPNKEAAWRYPTLLNLNPVATPTLDFHWPDMGAPRLGRTQWDTIVDAMLAAETHGKPFVLQVGCQGARGRTGTALAIIFWLWSFKRLGTKVADPVTAIRNLYHKDAVESVRQLDYIERVLGITLPAETFDETLGWAYDAPGLRQIG